MKPKFYYLGDRTKTCQSGKMMTHPIMKRETDFIRAILVLICAGQATLAGHHCSDLKGCAVTSVTLAWHFFNILAKGRNPVTPLKPELSSVILKRSLNAF